MSHERENRDRAKRAMETAASLITEAAMLTPDWMAAELGKIADDLRYWQGRLEANGEDKADGDHN